MFFSKLFSFFAMISVATFALAIPVPAPAPVGSADIAKRESIDFLSEVQTFQATITPLFEQLGQAASSGSDTTVIIQQLSEVFSQSTTVLQSVNVADIVPGLDTSSIVTEVVNIITTMVTSLSNFSVLNLGVGSSLDGLLSTWLSSWNVLFPGIASTIGSALPISSLPLSALLQLLNSVNALGVLGPVLTSLF